uniref:Cohesin subunit SA n=1 Tax=Mastacembelus armatus TaxID=205130 RepID=A0A7N9ATQ1_9TELE
MITEPTAAATSRPTEQTNNSHDEANSSAAVNHSGDESGNENRHKSVRRRKRAHNSSENVKGKIAKASCSSVNRAGGSRSKQKHVEAVTLFEVVTMGRSAMQGVIDDWIEAYLTDRDSSLLDLISFFIQCSGCKGVVTAEMCQSKDDSDVMSKMVEELDEDSVEYPLIQSGPYGRWFHSEFCEFVSVLVAQCQHSIIFDSYLMNTLISLLTELSNSYVRAFRHTCTLAAVKLLSSLVSVALSLSVGMENSQKLYEVQKTKTTRQKSTPQLEKIQKKITELQEKRAEIESMMDIIFKGVFLKRYRDVLPEIRSICMEELGLWMKLYSSAFLTDSYLKYMGWMMYDKIPDVRLKCVLSLQGLYGDPLLLPKLDLFTSRFKDRMISMTLDKDNEVAVQTMKLLVLISKISEDVLSPEDYSQLLQFVFSSQRPLAAAAGELLFSRYAYKTNPQTNTQLIVFTSILLVSLRLLNTVLHKHVVYLVDSLWDCGGALLKDWPTLTSILLQDSPEAVLVEILVASVRQASEGPALAGRSGAKKVMSAKEKKIQIDDCTKLTEHLLLVLPKLITKFSGSWDVVASLMKIPQYFLPEVAEAENTQVCMLPTLGLTGMGAVLDLHSGPAVLEAAARTYLSLCGEEMSWFSVTRAARDSLVQRWVDQLTALLEGSLQVKCTISLHGQNCHDLAQWNLFKLLSPLLLMEDSQGGAPPEVPPVPSAFLGVCDVLTAHSYQLHLWDPTSFGPLLYTPSPKLQRALLTFVCMQVFVGPDCDNQSRASDTSEVERLEDLHRRRNLLAAYCKLIVHGVLEMSMAAEIFMYYMKYYNDFGDIIKETMYRTRQIDKIESARTLVLCLQQLFVRLKKEQESGGKAHPGVQTFTSIKELARRYVLTFGDLVKFRECIVMIHRNGIEFVFQEFSQTPETPTPPYLSYLTILSEFSSKLLKPDKKTVFSYLQKHTAEHIIDLRQECWQPLIYYRASLLAVAEVEDAVSNVSSDKKLYLPNRSPFSKHKPDGTTPNTASHKSFYSIVTSHLHLEQSRVVLVEKPHKEKPSFNCNFVQLHSHQKTTDTDLFSVPLEPPAKRLSTEECVLSISSEAEDEAVEVEV